jgi:hypothetical protein
MDTAKVHHPFHEAMTLGTIIRLQGCSQRSLDTRFHTYNYGSLILGLWFILKTREVLSKFWSNFQVYNYLLKTGRIKIAATVGEICRLFYIAYGDSFNRSVCTHKSIFLTFGGWFATRDLYDQCCYVYVFSAFDTERPWWHEHELQ